MPKEGFSANPAIPEIVSGKTGSIKWTANPGDVKATTTVIGRYKGHDVTEVIYGNTKDSIEDNPEAPFSFVVFFYTTGEQGDIHIRPFFALSGEDVRWFDCYFNSTKEEPFTLVIESTSPGNGVYTTDWDFIFSDQQALIRRRTEGGRHVPTKDYEYSSSGKIVKVTTTDDN